MNRRHVDPAVWRALDECASAGDLYRGQLLDCIKIGYPVRGPLGGWGWSTGETGALRFHSKGDALLMVGAPALISATFPSAH